MNVTHVTTEGAAGFVKMARAQTTEPLAVALGFTVGLPLAVIVGGAVLGTRLNWPPNVTIAVIFAAALVAVPSSLVLRSVINRLLNRVG